MAHRRREPEPWRRLVERERLVSAMNATRWRETTEAMRLLDGGPPGFRIKDIASPGPPPDGVWDREWCYHPRPWETIEWLEIRPDPRQAQILSILKSIGAPISLEEGHIRIWGWLRPAASPSLS